MNKSDSIIDIETSLQDEMQIANSESISKS